MTEKIPRAFGFSGVVLAGTAIAAFVYMVALPYNLTALKDQFFSFGIGIQGVAAFLAILSGIAAVITGCRRLGLTAIILGVFAFVLAIGTRLLNPMPPQIIW